MNAKPVFITGISRGLGAALAEHYRQAGYPVYGLSRSGWQGEPRGIHEVQADLGDLDQIDSRLDALLGEVQGLKLVVLSAGALGEIRDMADTSLQQIRELMDVNVWANKLILDWLLRSSIEIEQIVLMSSGASVNGNRGWSAYGLSKATLNMLTRLYAHEFPHTHLAAFAPGLVDTAMQDYLCDEVDDQRFPSIANIKAARHTAVMPAPQQAAGLIAAAFERLPAWPGGSFVDIRQMPA